MTVKKETSLDPAGHARRNFLRAGVVGAAAAGVSVGAAVTPAAATENDSEKKKQRYQETAHVKKFYQTNRY
jgi:hypothetical protein